MGAMEVMHGRLPQSYFEIFGSPVTQDFTWYYIAALTLMITINVVIQPNSLIATGSAKGEYECRFGFVAGSYMKRVCTVLWGFFALMGQKRFAGLEYGAIIAPTRQKGVEGRSDRCVIIDDEYTHSTLPS